MGWVFVSKLSFGLAVLSFVLATLMSIVWFVWAPFAIFANLFRDDSDKSAPGCLLASAVAILVAGIALTIVSWAAGWDWKPETWFIYWTQTTTTTTR